MSHSLVLHIDSGCVSAGIAKGDQLVVSRREDYAVDKRHEERGMLTALRQSMSNILGISRSEGGVHHALVSLSSPWVKHPSRTSLLEVSEVHDGIADRRTIELIHDEIYRIFGVRKHVRFKSFLPLYFEINLEQFSADPMPKVVVKSGAELSEAMLVSGGKMRELVALGFGTKVQGRKISLSTGLPHELAESMRVLHHRGALHPSHSLYIADILREYEREERKAFEELAPKSSVYVITDDPLHILMRYSTRLSQDNI